MADVTPTDNDLLEYFSLIEGMHQRDQKLKKSDVLKNFLDTRSKKRKPVDEDLEVNPKAKRSKFLVTDEESDEEFGEDGLDDSDEEQDDLFDSVRAICDNGGDVGPQRPANLWPFERRHSVAPVPTPQDAAAETLAELEQDLERLTADIPETTIDDIPNRLQRYVVAVPEPFRRLLCRVARAVVSYREHHQ